jgi:hypothetical protein
MTTNGLRLGVHEQHKGKTFKNVDDQKVREGQMYERKNNKNVKRLKLRHIIIIRGLELEVSGAPATNQNTRRDSQARNQLTLGTWGG